MTPRLKASRRERISGSSARNLSDLACLFGAREIEEAVHLLVGDVGEQCFSGGTRIERATGVCARDERQAGRLFTHKVGEDDGVANPHPDEDSATELLGQLGYELVIE